MNNDNSTYAEPKKVSTGLIIGIVFLPYIFVWFLLKEGYSKKPRIISFIWLAVYIVLAFTIKGPDPVKQIDSFLEAQERYLLNDEALTESGQSAFKLKSDVQDKYADLYKNGNDGLLISTQGTPEQKDKYFDLVKRVDIIKSKFPDSVEKTESIDSLNSSSTKNSLSDIEQQMPEQQLKFINIHKEAWDNSENVKDDFQVNKFLKERKAKLANLLSGYNVLSWMGIVKDFGILYDGNGEAFLAVSIYDVYDAKHDFKNNNSIDLQTMQLYSDDPSIRSSLIKSNSSLYNVVSTLKSNDKIRFSGSFYPANYGASFRYIQDQPFSRESTSSNNSWTLDIPNYYFKFTKIEVIQ